MEYWLFHAAGKLIYYISSDYVILLLFPLEYLEYVLVTVAMLHSTLLKFR